MTAMNSAAAVNDPKESILKFANKKGSPKSPKCSLFSAFIPDCGSSQKTVGVKERSFQAANGP